MSQMGTNLMGAARQEFAEHEAHAVGTLNKGEACL